MKRISYIILMTVMISLDSLFAKAQGWPENYDGVMLQGFYWDSYNDTQWATLEAQADIFSKYFSLIWVPQSGYCNTLSKNMGYYPVYWLDQKSCFGTERELRSMIKTFKAKGIGTIADVVLNHKAGKSTWTDFANETRIGENTGRTYSIQWGTTGAPYICNNDECVAAGYPATGAADTGESDYGCRDLDHTNATLQKNVKTYEDFLLNEMGYTGFRYDMVKGYAPKYVGMYNAEAQPTFSVAEYWDGSAALTKNWINGTKVNADGSTSTTIQSGAFDFAGRYNIKDAFANGNWSSLGKADLASDISYQRYAITFVDNHDTGTSGKSGADPLYKDVEAANAFILVMPGTPCVFLLHWKNYEVTIKKLITLRKLLGIHSQSTILRRGTLTGGYYVEVQGTKGKGMVVLGSSTPLSTSGYKLALEGTDFRYYVSSDIDVSSLDKIKKEEVTWQAPACCEVKEGETCAFFEAPSSWTSTIKCWCWGNTNYTGGTWPGQVCVKVGTATNGNNIYKWTYTGTATFNGTGIIFSNNGLPQTADMVFVNGGYYNVNGQQGTVTVKKALTGDVNGDGVVNNADVNIIVSVICGTGGDEKAADVNNDGKVDITDITLLISIINN